jgi:hypothetical protein
MPQVPQELTTQSIGQGFVLQALDAESVGHSEPTPDEEMVTLRKRM